MNVTNNTGQDANDMHFYMYQNDQPSVQVVGASASCSAFGSVSVGLDSNNNRNVPPGQGPPYHGASVDMSGGTVPAGATVQVEVELCMNEKNCLKIKGPEWTSDGNPLPQDPGGGANGGWRVGGPFPGGNGGSPGDVGGGGRGAQEGLGGGDGNHVHMISIENDDDELCMMLHELKVLASPVMYPDITAIDWDSVDPVQNNLGEPPILIPPNGSWRFPFETTGSYLGGHVYTRLVAHMIECGKGAKEGDDAEPPVVFGDHPNPAASIDNDADSLWDDWEYAYGLDTTDDGSTDPDNGPAGDPDGDGVTNFKEQLLLTDPLDAASPPNIEIGYDLLRTVAPVIWDFGTPPLTPLPAGFFGPGSDPFDGVIALVGYPLDYFPTCPGDMGLTDTILRRTTVAALSGVPSYDMVEIEMVALSLVSAEPIRVTYDGGMVDSFFHVFTLVDSMSPPSGGMKITKTHGNGGDCMITLNLMPGFMFMEVGNPSNQFFLWGPDVGAHDMLGASNVPWQQLAPELDCPGCCSEFVPGYNRGARLPFTLHGDLIEHVVEPSCPSASPGAGDVLAGHDLLISTGDTQLEFGYGLPPIPADFFGPGSDPFEGQVTFQGVPVEGGTPCSGDLANTSIIVKRSGPATLPSPGSSDTIPIEIVAMSLVSTTPIRVESFPAESFFDVYFTVSPMTPSTGSMTISRDSEDGGTCDIDLWLYPKFTFVPAGGPGKDAIELDGAAYGFVSHLRAEDVPWINDSTGLGWPVSCASNFALGIDSQAKYIVGAKTPFSLSGIGATIPLGPTDFSADTDGDGLTGFEEAALGTDPDNPDTDNDGLPDGWEYQYGLDPLDNTGDNGSSGDPDHDGVSNAMEYEGGTNPMDPEDTPLMPLQPWLAAVTLIAAALVFFRAASTKRKAKTNN